MANSINYQLVKHGNPEHLPRLLDIQNDLQRSVAVALNGQPAPIIVEAINAALAKGYALATDERG